LYDITINESRLITYYDGPTQIATLNAPFSGAWAIGDSYDIRYAPPTETAILAAVGSSTSITLAGTASIIDNYYVGNYVYMLNGTAIYDARMITAYNGTTKVATVLPFTVLPTPGDTYQILPFTRDNSHNLEYNGSTVSQNEVSCYEIRLLRLTLPNTNLYSGYGNRPPFYPYMFVELTTTSSPNSNIIYTNNPNACKALFTVTMTDDKEPTRTSFLHFESEKMIQTVKFKPNDNLSFSVYLPNKELFKTQADTISPLAPDPDIQISALFQIRKI
jgi:hypothetical protein